MNTRKRFAAAAIALALSVPVAAVAQEAATDKPERHARRGHAMRGGSGGHLLGRAARHLNLTDQQKEFARQLMTDTRKQAEPIVTQLRQNRQELAEAVKSNNAAAIDQISQRQAPLVAQLSAMRSKAMASFYAQLTPEQKAKADEFQSRVKDRAARWQKRG